jgi:hypothetical protein
VTAARERTTMPIRQRFGDMDALDGVGAIEIGERAGDP